MKANGAMLQGCSRGALLLAALLTLSSFARAADLKNMRPLFGPFVRPGQWLPVEVSLENRGQPASMNAALEFTSESRLARYYTRVNLPSPSSKRLIVYGMAEADAEVTVPGAKQPKLDLKALEANDSLIGVISKEEGGLSFLASLSNVGRPPLEMNSFGFRGTYSAQGKLYVHYLQPAGLPDRWVGYDMLRALVLLDGSPREIDADRARALQQWVASGGTLVVTGGSEWQRLREGFLADLLPFEATGTRVLAGAPALVARYGAPLGRDPLMITTGRVKSGVTFASERGSALIVRSHYGAGNVVFLAFDPSRPPIAGWRGSEGLWRDLLKWADERPRYIDPNQESEGGGSTPFGGRRSRYYRNPYQQGYQSLVSAFAQERKEMRAPPFEIIGLFLIVYLVCLVPANYLVLKKLDRREWAWVTTPLIVAVFTLTSYGVGYSLKGGTLILSKLTIVQSNGEQGTGRADTLFGLFSPGKRNYNLLAADRDATCSDIATGETAAQRAYLKVNEDKGFRVEEAAINMWTMRMFQSHAVVGLGQGIRSRFRVSQGTPMVELTNQTGRAFTEAMVLTTQGAATIAKFEKGQTVKLALKPGAPSLGSTSAIRTSAYGALQLQDPSRQIVNLGGAEALFLGWSDASLDSVQIANERPDVNSQTLVAVRLPVQYEEGTLAVAQQSVPGVVVESKTSQPLSQDQTFGINASSELHLDDGWLVYEIKLPHGGDALRVDSLSVRAQYQGPPGASVSAYNFAQHRWVPLEERKAGSQQMPQMVPLDPADDYVLRPDSVVRVRIDAGPAKGVRIRSVAAAFSGRLVASRSRR